MIFGLWLIPVFIVMAASEGAKTVGSFLESIDLKEPFTYFVLIAIATCRPLQNLFDALMIKVSRIFGNRVFFFWAGTLFTSALLSGIFSSVAIMTLSCLYLSSAFFSLKPSRPLAYLTVSLLFLGIGAGVAIFPVNFSFFHAGGREVFALFGWKMLIALIFVFGATWLLFRKEFKTLQAPFRKRVEKPHPIRLREIFYVALFMLASFGKENVYWLLLCLAFVIILHKGFYRVKGEEGNLSLYFPIVIAFFTYTLEIHASLQKWWVLPIFERVEGFGAYGVSFLLTGLNEHIPLEGMKEVLGTATRSVRFYSYLGVLAGGGLTLIAKSANVVAKLTLREHFPRHAISPSLQFLTVLPFALFLSAVAALLFTLGGIG